MRRQNVDDGWVILDELLKPAFAIFARKFLGYGAAIRIEARFHYLPGAGPPEGVLERERLVTEWRIGAASEPMLNTRSADGRGGSFASNSVHAENRSMSPSIRKRRPFIEVR